MKSSARQYGPSKRHSFLAGAALAWLLLAPAWGQDRPKVCSNRELIKAFEIIDSSCSDLDHSCDFAKLRQLDRRVDRPTLLAALEDPYLHHVHIFFPLNESRLDRALDWNTGRRDQLEALSKLTDLEGSILYILGRASAVGDLGHNVALSRQRMMGVLDFLQRQLGLQAAGFHGAWLGREILQLKPIDIASLRIHEHEFRGDPYVLNQSVHIIVFPCSDQFASPR